MVLSVIASKIMTCFAFIRLRGDLQLVWRVYHHILTTTKLNRKKLLPSNVGGACGAENVRNSSMLLHYYQALLNSISGSSLNINKIET